MRLRVAAVVLLALTGCAAGEPSPSPTAPAPTVTVTQTAPPIPEATKTVTVEVTVTAQPPAAEDAEGIGPGVWRVGEDVKAGTYRAEADEDGSCYWALLSSTGGEDNIIDNQRTEGQSIVEVKKSAKYFETDGCTPWVRL